MTDLLHGFMTVLTPANLFFAAIGVTLGTLVGVLPGIGPAVTIALLLPVAYQMDDPAGAFIMFAGIYYGAMYGGSTTSILLNTPGESASVATAMEGHLMAKNGRARAALASAAIGSFIAGTISTIALTFVAIPIGRWATTVNAADYAALMILALVTVTSLVGSSVVRGLIALMMGMTIGLVGFDDLSGQPRLTFGQSFLFDGISEVVLIIGLFAIGETLYVMVRGRTRPGILAPLPPADKKTFLWLSKEDWKRSWAPWLRGAAFGFPFGVLPSGGAELPTFLSYSYERRRSRGRDEFGRGAIEGVAGPEAANNASFSGVLVPLLTLGLPTSATAAVLIAAFQVFNLQPGPQLFEKQSELVWALIASLYVGNVMLLLLNLPLIRLWVKVLQIPRPLLYAGILLFATLGVFAVSGNPMDILLAYALGGIGLLMRLHDFPIAPVILGAILGPNLETQVRRALTVSNGDWMTFLANPLSAFILFLALCAFLLPYAPAIVARLRGQEPTTTKLTMGDED